MVDAAQQRLIVLVGADDWAEARPCRRQLPCGTGAAQKSAASGRTDHDQPQQDWLALFQQHRLVLVTPGDEAALRSQAATAYWVDTALAKLYSPFGGVKPGAWQDDPFGLFGGWIQARTRETPVRPRDGRLFVSDGKRAICGFAVHACACRPFPWRRKKLSCLCLSKRGKPRTQSDPQVEVAAAGVILYAAAAGAQAKWEMSIIGIGSLARHRGF